MTNKYIANKYILYFDIVKTISDRYKSDKKKILFE